MLFACESRSLPSYLYQTISVWFTKNPPSEGFIVCSVQMLVHVIKTAGL
jgi:hypothetical protein